MRLPTFNKIFTHINFPKRYNMYVCMCMSLYTFSIFNQLIIYSRVLSFKMNQFLKIQKQYKIFQSIKCQPILYIQSKQLESIFALHSVRIICQSSCGYFFLLSYISHDNTFTNIDQLLVIIALIFVIALFNSRAENFNVILRMFTIMCIHCLIFLITRICMLHALCKKYNSMK